MCALPPPRTQVVLCRSSRIYEYGRESLSQTTNGGPACAVALCVCDLLCRGKNILDTQNTHTHREVHVDRWPNRNRGAAMHSRFMLNGTKNTIASLHTPVFLRLIVCTGMYVYIVYD